MSAIYQRGEVWYIQYFHRGRKTIKSLKTKDPRMARDMQKLYDAKLVQAKSGMLPASVPIAAAAENFLRGKEKTITPQKAASYRYRLMGAVDFLEKIGVTKVAEISEALIGSLVDLLRDRGKAPSTILSTIKIIRSMIRGLLVSRTIPESPVKFWPRIKETPAKPDRIGFYSVDEIIKLKAYFKGREFEPLFLFAIFTGARWGEIVLARKKDVLLSEGVILLRNHKIGPESSGLLRPVAIHPDIEDILAARAKGNPEDALFPETSEHVYYWSSKEMQAACEASGVSYKRFHGLRHTFISHLLAGGVDLRQTQAAVGHKRLSTTQRYSHLVRGADVRKLGY